MRTVGNSLVTVVVFIIVVLLLMFAADKAFGASMSQLNHRETRQVASLHKYYGTLRFFKNHPRQAHSHTGKKEIRKAKIWIRVINKELDQTRQEKKAKYKPAVSYSYAQASWYGPGFYGNGMACGGTLTKTTMGVANKSLSCGTMITICSVRCARVPVVDRGPYIAGREFDLTGALKTYIGFGSTGTVKWCVC